MGKKFVTFLFLSILAFNANAAYRVVVETVVAGRTEDKFSFELEKGKSQKKGFEGRLFAKRYGGKGFDHPMLRLKLKEKELDKLYAESLKQKAQPSLIDQANDRLNNLERSLRNAESRLEGQKDSLTPLKTEIAKLEEWIKLYETNRPKFTKEFGAYIEAKEPKFTEADLKARKAALYAKRRSDYEEINIGSYCEMSILREAKTAVLVNLDFAYSRLHSWFYSEGINNNNNISKFPIIETFEKFDVKDLTLFLGKPYCFQFARPVLDAGKSSLATATSGTILANMPNGGAGDSLVNAPTNADNALNTAGLLSDILQKHRFDGGKVVRVIIRVTRITD